MAQEPNQPEFDDLMGLDLRELDLRHIELEEEKGPNPIWRWVALVFLLGCGALLLWLPTTHFYQSSSASNAIFAGTCITATVVGVLGGRWLWRWAEASALRWAARRKPRVKQPPKPPTAAQRWLTLLAAVAGASVIGFAVSPTDLRGGSSGYTQIWYAVAAAAIVVGFLLARWLMMQEYNPFKRPGRVARAPTPPWVKWVTLAVLVLGSLGILLGVELLGDGGGRGDSSEFSLGGAAFVIGIFAAIWVARRFDETEAKIRREVAQRRAATRGVVIGRPPE